MVVNEVGAVLIGSVVGWMLVRTMRQQDLDWKAFSGVVVMLVGGSGLNFLVDKNLVGYFWIGTFAGFVANIVARIVYKKPDLPAISVL